MSFVLANSRPDDRRSWARQGYPSIGRAPNAHPPPPSHPPPRTRPPTLAPAPTPAHPPPRNPATSVRGNVRASRIRRIFTRSISGDWSRGGSSEEGLASRSAPPPCPTNSPESPADFRRIRRTGRLPVDARRPGSQGGGGEPGRERRRAGLGARAALLSDALPEDHPGVREGTCGGLEATPRTLPRRRAGCPGRWLRRSRP